MRAVYFRSGIFRYSFVFAVQNSRELLNSLWKLTIKFVRANKRKIRTNLNYSPDFSMIKTLLSQPLYFQYVLINKTNSCTNCKNQSKKYKRAYKTSYCMRNI